MTNKLDYIGNEFGRAWVASRTEARRGVYTPLSYIDINEGNRYDGDVFAQIMYWHEPNIENGESRLSRQLTGDDVHFWLAKNHADWFRETRITKRTVRRSLDRIKARKLIFYVPSGDKGKVTPFIRVNWDEFERRMRIWMDHNHADLTEDTYDEAMKLYAPTPVLKGHTPDLEGQSPMDTKDSPMASKVDSNTESTSEIDPDLELDSFPPATSAGTVLDHSSGTPEKISGWQGEDQSDLQKRKEAAKQRFGRSGAPQTPPAPTKPEPKPKRVKKTTEDQTQFAPAINKEISEIIKAWLDHSLITPEPGKNYYAIPKVRIAAGDLATKGVTGDLTIKWFKSLREDDFWKSKGIDWKMLCKNLYAWCVGEGHIKLKADPAESNHDPFNDDRAGDDDPLTALKAMQEANTRPAFQHSADTIPADLAARWKTAYDQLEIQLDTNSFRSWLRESATLVAVEGSVWDFEVGSEQKAQFLQHRLNREIRRVLRDVTGCKDLDVRFHVAQVAIPA